MSGYERFKNFLKEDGFKYNEDGTSLAFKYQGFNMLAFMNNGSPYLQLTLILSADGKSADDLVKFCNDRNSERFIVKFTTSDGAVWCNYEFLPNDHTTAKMYELALDTLCTAAHDAIEKY